MLTQQKPIRLSLVSFDLPIWSIVETNATLYQKDDQRFHLLLTEPLVLDPFAASEPEVADGSPTPRLLWLEMSPYRAVMTMQGNGKYSYRHYWEPGVFGLSRYWLQSADSLTRPDQLRFRNYTRSLLVTGNPAPQHFRVEYELWASQVQIGCYVMNVEIG